MCSCGNELDTEFTIDGQAKLAKDQFLVAVLRWADPGYFQTIGVPLKREEMAATFFPNEDPIGKWVRISPTAAYQIIGIVGDTR